LTSPLTTATRFGLAELSGESESAGASAWFGKASLSALQCDRQFD
jgi:hypothetical protein